jgi:hypothetical protein
MVMALRAAGIYRGGLTGANWFTWNKSLSNFESKIADFESQGLRLIDVETYVANGQRKWAGVFRPGTQNFVHGIPLASFTQQLNAPANQGLAPWIIEIYEDSGQILVAAIFRSGILAPNITLVLDVTSSALHTANTQNIANGVRLADIQPWLSRGQVRWAAVWLSGTWDSYLLLDQPFQSFKQQTQDKFDDDGMRLMDLETYVVNSQRLWAGYGRKASWANYFIAGYTLQNFKNKIEHEFNENGRRLTRLEVYSV